MKKYFLFPIITLSVFVLISCSANSDKFVGTRKAVGYYHNEIYSITKSGDNFIWEVHRNGRSMGKNSATYNKSQDKLVVGGNELELIYDNLLSNRKEEELN